MSVTEIHPLQSLREVVAVADRNPLARNTAAAGVHGWAAADAVVWTGRVDRPLPLLAGVGAPDAVASLIDAVADDLGETEVSGSLPRGCPSLLRRWAVEPLRDWDLFACATAPAAPLCTVEWLTPADHGEVARLLDAANPGSSARPGDPRVRRWAGIRDGAGHLVCCGADTSRVDGLGHLSGIATMPEHRGHGLGGDVTAFLTRELLGDSCDTVCLGMYAENAAARSVYRRLGYTEVARSTGAHLCRREGN